MCQRGYDFIIMYVIEVNTKLTLIGRLNSVGKVVLDTQKGNRQV